MTQAVNPPQAAKSMLGALYSPIKDELAAVERILQEELCSDDPFVDELVRYGFMLGGKRLRPALLLLTAKAAGAVKPEHSTLGAVVEMIHMATLIHDDVLDEATTRRHLATVNSRWDNEASVLLGDFLFTHSFFLASTLETTLACRWIGEATNVVCEGELRQKGSRGNFLLSEADYLSIIEAKTAELVACSCKLGAYFAGASEEVVAQMDAYGRNLGIAFQIADDLLDVLGDEQVTGKSLGTDFDKQKPTLPLIRVFQCIDGAERASLLGTLENNEVISVDTLQPYFDEFNAIQYARDRATHFARQAGAQLRDLPDSASRDVLRAITDFVVTRPM